MVSLDQILVTGLLMAFIFPGFALISESLPLVGSNAAAYANTSAQLNNTAGLLNARITGTYGALNRTLLGNSTGFNANPTIFNAFAFIISGLGTLMTDIVQLPYVDYLSMQVILTGMAPIIPPIAMNFIFGGLSLMLIYMVTSLLVLGWSSIQKYDLMHA